jgi:hypothetical protein
MATIRVRFTEPVPISTAVKVDVPVPEVTVSEGARVLVVSAEGEVLLDVPADQVADVGVVVQGRPSAEAGASERLAELKERNPNHGRAWTAAEEQELARLFHDGVSVPELVERLGRSRGGIRSALVRLGLVERKTGASAEE